MKNRLKKEAYFWNSFSDKYDSFIQKNFGQTYDQIFQKLSCDISKTDEILEIATGTGLVAFEISNKVKQINAVDVSPEMILKAKEKQLELKLNNINFEVGDICNLQFKDSVFDLVIASNVMHLLYEPQKALFEINRVLKTNGKAILPTFCHGENLKSLILSKLASLVGFKAQNRWSINEFNDFIEKNGFKKIRSETIQGKIPLNYLVMEKK